jgi:hypothetical protein
MDLWAEGRLLVSRAGTAFGPDGALADAKQQEQLRSFMAGFAAFVQRRAR